MTTNAPAALPAPGTSSGLCIAIVGAESTGKTWLARHASEHLASHRAVRSTWVPEVLRQWCDEHGRTPRIDEQAAIAAEQARRITEAAARFELVLCDTTPLMTAVYSEHVFGDRSLHYPALRWQRSCALTLVTALDLPWQADGLQRDGPHVREPIDNLLQQLLDSHALPWRRVHGQGDLRLESVLEAIAPWLGVRATEPTGSPALARHRG
jgi:nicotinamide riboside kinase